MAGLSARCLGRGVEKTRNRLKPEHESHPAKIVEAVEALVDDFTEGKLVTVGDGR